MDNTGQTASSNNQNDEVDLLKLLERFIFFLNYNKKRLLISLLSGIAIGILLYASMSKKYSATLVLHSSILTNSEEIQIVDNWNEMIRRGEHEAIASEFNCNPVIVSKLSKITAEEIQKIFAPNNPIGFTVELMVRDTSVLDELRDGIIYALENNQYVKERINWRKSDLQELINKVNIEITKLDSTKSNIEHLMRTSAQRTSPFIVDISDANNQQIILNEKLIKLKEELQFIRAIQPVQFIKFRNPISVSLLSFLMVGLLVGIVSGFISSIYATIRKKIHQTKT